MVEDALFSLVEKVCDLLLDCRAITILVQNKCSDFSKDGSWNSMLSAHPIGQIFADLVICPYRFVGEECRILFPPNIQKGAIFSHY